MSGSSDMPENIVYLFHQMSVKSTLTAVCMEESAMILSTVTHVAVAGTVETTAKPYLTSVLYLLISVPTVFATMTTTSPLQSVCATSPTVWVSWTNNKLFFCSTGFSKHINCTFQQNPCSITHQKLNLLISLCAAKKCNHSGCT